MFRTLAALLLLAIVVGVGIRLGNWQLDRAAQRVAIRAAIEAGRSSPPLSLNSRSPAQALTPWRPATATGVWLHQYTVLLDNRSHNGIPGYWVATPLMLNGDTDADTTEQKSAVLVLRGWLPRPLPSGEPPLAMIPVPAGTQFVKGELLQRVPRLYELWSWSRQRQESAQLPTVMPDASNGPPIVQNLDLTMLEQASGLTLLPAVLAADSGSSSTLLQDWPEPSLDADQNRGYALQWFGFATIAGIAWVVVLWRALRRRRQRPSD